MGNKALRTRLSNLLKEKKVHQKLYKNVPKLRAFRVLRADRLRHMIAFLENVEVGMKVYDYGVNHIVAKPVTFEVCIPYKSINKLTSYGGYVLSQARQLEYTSGYRGCGCGNYYCNVDKKLKTKEEIISGFIQSHYSEWRPSYLEQDYFKLLEKGVDILTEDGFLVDNCNELLRVLRQTI